MPAELAKSIISAVTSHVEVDLDSLRADLLERLAEPSEEHIWTRAERIVEDAIDDAWAPELVAQCKDALGKAGDDFLVAAASCREAARDLQLKGCESWIAGAIRHDLAREITWQKINELSWHRGTQAAKCQAVKPSSQPSHGPYLTP